MSRELKKFIYTVFYFFLFVLLVFNLFLKPVFEKKTPVTPKTVINPLIALSRPQILPYKEDKSVFLIRINNPNEKYGAFDFTYEVKVYDNEGYLLGQKIYPDFIHPLSQKYLFRVLDVDYKRVKNVHFEFKDINWQEKENFKKPLVLVQSLEGQIDEKNQVLRIKGEIFNNEIFSLNEAEVLVMVYDKMGYLITADRKIIFYLNSKNTRSFSFEIPLESYILNQVDINKTEIFVYAY